MNTLLSIVILIFGGAFLGWLTIVILPLIGTIGEAIAGAPEKRSKIRLSIGIWIGAIFQSYFYFSFIALVISWTIIKTNSDSWSKFIIWLIAFLICILPIFMGSTRLKVHQKSKQTGKLSPIAESMQITAILSFIAFFLFVFYPRILKTLWHWVPFV